MAKRSAETCCTVASGIGKGEAECTEGEEDCKKLHMQKTTTLKAVNGNEWQRTRATGTQPQGSQRRERKHGSKLV